MSFSDLLLNWYKINKRNLPWRHTNDAYFIWIAEIILQQTKVNQGMPYYLKFVKNFPTIKHLALANQDKVLNLWQGLGYYSRARNLHFSAKYILENYNGVFPNQYDKILNLKGVGHYTAAAIASFAFGLPYAVVDGNVVRVLSRVFGIDVPFETVSGKKIFQQLSQELLDKKNPADYNQAIMDFGSLHCSFRLPKCNTCVFSERCVAYTTNTISKFPLKVKKISMKKRYLHYLVIKKDDNIMLGKISEGVWIGLYEFPFIEFLVDYPLDLIFSSKEWNGMFKNLDYEVKSVSKQYVHKLSHQHIYAYFWTINVNAFKLKKYSFIKNSEVKNYPISRLIDKFLQENYII